MTKVTPRPRVLILANRAKPLVTEALEAFRPWLEERADIVAEPDITTVTRDAVRQLPEADLAMVLGGDGTLLSQSRQMTDLGVAVLGVNFGKLGFLAEFSLEDVQKHWTLIITGQCRTSERMMMDVRVYPAGASTCEQGTHKTKPLYESTALNDTVITAGAPFRMIELELAIDPRPDGGSAATFSGDGVIVSTPSGSTAYNIGAGGPIVSPDLDAFCITPLCPHSLAFRPIVVNASSNVCLRVNRANKGTTLVIDGQESFCLQVGQQVLVRRHDKALTLVQNPDLSYWTMLAKKMHWAARPRRG